MTITRQVHLAALVCCLMVAPSAFGGVITTYIGSDNGAGAPGAGSNAAAAAFDTAVGTERLITFELPLVATNSVANQTIPLPPSVSVTGNYIDIANTQVCSPGLCGNNTTPGGSQWLGVYGGSLTFNFTSPINFFGAYFGGLQGSIVGQETITFNDGSAETVDIPMLNSGFAFVGFTDTTSFSSVTINALNDIVSVDDVRVPSSPTGTPEPASAVLLGSAVLIGLAARMRRKSL